MKPFRRATLCVRHARGHSIRVSMRRKSRILPAYWSRVDNCLRRLPSAHTLALWVLVLESRNIPYLQTTVGTRQQIYVPPVAEECARRELQAFAAERPATRTAPQPAARRSGQWAVLFFMALLIWHGTIARWWGIPDFLPSGLVQILTQLAAPDVPHNAPHAVALGSMDTFRLWADGQWYRLVTALTLHSGTAHVLSNMAFGLLFGTLLCLRTGLGCGILLMVLGGIGGNALNAAMRIYYGGAFVSLGFSTGVFAAVGALAGWLALAEARQDRRKAFVPLAAGGAILAMLGTEGENVDYLAHLFGLASGFCLGMFSHRLEGQWQGRVPCGWIVQWGCGLASVAILALAWVWALS